MRALLTLRDTSLLLLITLILFGCETPNENTSADLIVHNARIYTLAWADPATDGTPADDAPYENEQWQPDAEAIAIRDGKVLFVGTNDEVEAYRGEATTVLDAQGGTIIPGLVDAHTHVAGLGANLDRVDLREAQTEEEAVELVAARAAETPAGEWIIGFGWDEGAWANRYPDMQLLTERVPNHPVIMRGLHGFAAWGNQLALETAGITTESSPGVGGEIVKDANGALTGLFMNNAVDTLYAAVPPPTPDQLKRQVLAGLNEMARSGYVAVHEAGVGSDVLAALESLANDGQLPIRVYAMLKATDEDLIRTWIERGPYDAEDGMLSVRSVKAYYDGALGSRGARLLEDYSDMPGHRGVSGEDYGFNQDLVEEIINAGFQTGIHAIGDAGNRETLDFYDRVIAANPEAQSLRLRIEHAQVIHPDDFPRLQAMNLVASMQPPHAVEDKTWAEDRLGPERIKGAYAWRTLRQLGVPVIMGSDLTGSDHNIFYGLHAAITRRSKDLQPPEGWYMKEALTSEEALRSYTTWPAYGAFWEDKTGMLAPGRWADFTILNVDPLNVGITNPADLFDGAVQYTIVSGNIAYQQ